MKFYNDFNEKQLKDVAKEADNKQLLKDIQYTSFLLYHNKNKCNIYVERSECSFILGQFQKNSFRIIGLATSIKERGKGWAKLLLKRAEKIAKTNGCKSIHTRSLSGVEFYIHNGFQVVGFRGGGLFT